MISQSSFPIFISCDVPPHSTTSVATPRHPLRPVHGGIRLQDALQHLRKRGGSQEEETGSQRKRDNNGYQY